MNTKCVLVGVCGGIAAYKALDVISSLKKRGFEIHVIMTKSSTEFVTPLSFQSISQNLVVKDMFDEPKAWEIQHISLAKKADLVVIIPATANIIGKVANGIADDMLSTTIMATRAPVLFAPAMNTNMYTNIIVQENIEKLKKYGYEFINPEKGRLACGDFGDGKLASTNLIADIVESKLYPIKDMVGKKVLVTAGPTIAELDPVRFITNKSTGKMGYEVAKEARDRGAEVTLITGPSNLEKPFGVKVIEVKTNEDMYNEIIKTYEEQDIVIKSAAVADYKPESYSKEKIKKQNEDLNITFVRDRDILKELGKIKKTQILIGFAAESNNLIANAIKKLMEKNLDYIIANDITSSDTGFASDDNKVSIISSERNIISLEKMTKKQVACNLFNIVNKSIK